MPSVPDLVLATNPDPDSSLPYLLRVPIGDGLVFRVKGTWPRTSAIYCHPVPAYDWPVEPEIVERVPLRSCARRGAAIDIVADRDRENRSQLVFTKARGRDVVFWQAPRTRKQSRPNVTVPTARASGTGAPLEILVDVRERYPWTFARQAATTSRAALRPGDYAVRRGDRVVAAVERKSMDDLTSSVTSGRLRYALGELAALPRAAVVIEDRYSALFKVEHVRPSVVVDQLAELQVRWPSVPIVFVDNRRLAEEWAYRFLAAAVSWADQEEAVTQLVAPLGGAAPVPPSAAELRAWARQAGLAVSDRGRVPATVLAAYREAHP